MIPRHALGLPPLRLGFLAFVEHDRVSGNHSEALCEGIELFRFAEELGYDSGWVRGRHFQSYVSSPMAFLSAVAASTSRIRLGTGVVPLRYENPIRLAEDASTVDLLSNGRLHLGLSSGQANSETLLAGVFGETEREDYYGEVDHRLTRLIGALRGETLALSDETFAMAPVGTPIRVQPASPGLGSRLYYGAGRASSAARAGELGMRLQLSEVIFEGAGEPFAEVQARMIDAYLAALAPDVAPYIVASRTLLPASAPVNGDTFDELRAEQAERRSGRVVVGGRTINVADAQYGDADEIVAGLAQDAALGRVDEFIVTLQAGFTHATYRRILELVATEVAPRIGSMQLAAEPAVGAATH